MMKLGTVKGIVISRVAGIVIAAALQKVPYMILNAGSED